MPPTTTTLDQLTLSFRPSACKKPRLDVVPLFPCLGWTPAQVADLADAEEVTVAAGEGRELLDQLNAARAARGRPSLSLTVTGADGGGSAGGGAAAPGAPAPASRVLGGWAGPLRFAKVAVGGTFDRLHAGHRLLLAATALVSSQYIFVGITGADSGPWRGGRCTPSCTMASGSGSSGGPAGRRYCIIIYHNPLRLLPAAADQLLAKKRNADLLEPYAAREAAAVAYMQAVNPGVTVVAGPLSDPKVGRQGGRKYAASEQPQGAYLLF